MGRFAQGKITEVLLTQSSCALLSSHPCSKVQEYYSTPKKLLRFSFKVKKTTYFYASFVHSLTESLELKYSKNTQAGLKNFSSNVKYHKYPENQGTEVGTFWWATFLIGAATNFSHSQAFMCFVYCRLHCQLLCSMLKINWKIKRGKQKGGRAASWTWMRLEKLFCGSDRHRWTVSPACHGLRKLSQTHTHHSNTEGFHNMNSLHLSQGHVPESHSQSDWRLNASGAVEAAKIKLSQSYFSRWKRNLRCLFGLDARKRIPGQATGNSACVPKEKLEQVSHKLTFRERKAEQFLLPRQ